MDKMPVIFVGHGSPMNAIEDNEFTRGWRKMAAGIPRPQAILAISAHWYTDGTRIMDDSEPGMIYDMYGFSHELYEVVYPAPGARDMAAATQRLVERSVMDKSWGYDHGAWSVLRVMFPEADIPVYQMSVDRRARPDVHFEIGKQLKSLREKDVLILGSGNVVHNFAYLQMNKPDGHDWAYEFDNYIRDKIIEKNYTDVIDYKKAGKCADMAFSIPDHFYPLLYTLGAASGDDNAEVYNNSCTMGSMSMTCYVIR